MRFWGVGMVRMFAVALFTLSTVPALAQNITIGAVQADDSAVTLTSTPISIIGGLYDAVPVNCTDGNVCMALISQDRRLLVDAQIAGQDADVAISDGGNVISVDDGAGALTVDNAGTFAVQEDGAALTALQLIDNPVAVDDTATHTPAVTSVTGIGAVATPTDTTVNANDIGMPAMSTDRRLLIDAQIAGQDADVAIADGGNAISVDDNGATLSVDDGAGALTVDGTVTADAGTGPWPVTDNGGALTVDNAGTFATQVDGAALTALQLIDNPVLADDAAFTLTTSSVGMAGAIQDISLSTLAAADGDAVPLRVNDQGALHVTGGGGGTEYTEDSPAAANPIGGAVILVRDDVPGAQVSLDGDNVAQRGTDYGAAFVQVVDSSGSFVDSFGGVITSFPDNEPFNVAQWNGVAPTAAAALADNMANPTTPLIGAALMTWDGATWDRASLASDVTEDAAEAGGESGPLVLTVRRDTAASSTITNGDFATMNTDAAGHVWVRDRDIATIFGTDTVFGTAGTADADVLTVQGIAGMTAVTVSATNLDVQIGGSDTVQVQSNSANLATETTAATLLTTTAHDAALGVAGTADAQVRSVQGIAGMTPVTVSATDLDVQSGGADLATSAQGAAIQTAVEILDNVVSGSEAQVDVVTFPDNEPFNVAQVGGQAAPVLGTTTYTEATSTGVMLGAVRNDVLAALANTDNEIAPLQVNATGALYTVSAANSGVDIGDVDVLSLPHVDLEDAAETAGGDLGMVGTVRRDAAASSAGQTGDNATLNTDENGLAWARFRDPCSGFDKSYFVVDIVTSATTEIANAVAGEFLHICSMMFFTAGANNVVIVEDDTDACASPTAGMTGGTTAAEGFNFVANQGYTFGNGNGTVARTSVANRYVCIITSAAVQLSGVVSYVTSAAP